MERQYKKQSYRMEIQSEKERIRPEEIFCTQAYRELMQSLIRELTDGRSCSVQLYSAPWENRMGWCDGKRIAINWGNALTAGFLTMAQKNISLIGVAGHECGHKNYSNFVLRRKYLDGILDGIWYPYPPETKNPQEAEALEQIKGYFGRKDRDALALIGRVADYLHNILEDIYVEEKMCARFPGSVRKGILLNRERNAEWIPSLRKLLEDGEDHLSVLMNLCAQYALSGRINNWDGLENDLLETMKELMPVIRDCCQKEGSSIRYLAVNRIILKIWKYLYEIIREMENQREEQEKEGQGKGAQEKEEKEQEGDDCGNGEGNAQEEGEDAPTADSKSSSNASDGQTGNTGGTPETSPSMQEYLAHLASVIPHITENEAETGVFTGFPEDVPWDGSWERKPSEAQGAYGSVQMPEDTGTETEKKRGEKAENGKAGETDAVIGSAVAADTEGRFQEILWEMARQRVDARINAEINLRLQKELDGIEFDAGHRKVKKEVCRQYAVTEQQKKQYRKYQEQVKKVQRRLRSAILPILQEREARTERYLFMGRRIDMRSIANPQGAIYRKQNPGKKVDMAAFILIDMSESMTGERMAQAKLAASCLYDFCKKAGIAVAVYGHHTDGFRHRRLEDETVYLHCCAEFEPDKNDGFRISALQPAGANRDGVALKFAGKKLLERREEQKLLVLVSDGFPNSNQYRGEPAKKDLAAIRKELMGGGIAFIAAAIGADKEKIREIYGSSFLDISKLDMLPVTLTKQFIKQIRRYS